MKMSRCVWMGSLLLLLALVGCTDNEKTARQWMEEGIRHFQAGDYQAAERAYEKAIQLEPANALLYNYLGMAYRFQFNQTGDRGAAVRETEAFEKAVELNSRFLAAVKNLAATLHRDGNFKGAAEMARRALMINPEDPEKEILKTWIREDSGKED